MAGIRTVLVTGMDKELAEAVNVGGIPRRQAVGPTIAELTALARSLPAQERR